MAYKPANYQRLVSDLMDARTATRESEKLRGRFDPYTLMLAGKQRALEGELGEGRQQERDTQTQGLNNPDSYRLSKEEQYLKTLYISEYLVPGRVRYEELLGVEEIQDKMYRLANSPSRKFGNTGTTHAQELFMAAVRDLHGLDDAPVYVPKGAARPLGQYYYRSKLSILSGKCFPYTDYLLGADKAAVFARAGLSAVVDNCKTKANTIPATDATSGFIANATFTPGTNAAANATGAAAAIAAVQAAANAANLSPKNADILISRMTDAIARSNLNKKPPAKPLTRPTVVKKGLTKLKGS